MFHNVHWYNYTRMAIGLWGIQEAYLFLSIITFILGEFLLRVHDTLFDSLSDPVQIILWYKPVLFVTRPLLDTRADSLWSF